MCYSLFSGSIINLIKAEPWVSGRLNGLVNGLKGNIKNMENNSRINNFLKNYGWLTLILLLGAAFRLVFINWPHGLYVDQAQNAWDAINALTKGQWHWYYPGNGGREGLYIDLVAVSYWLFGVGVWQERLPGVLIGISTLIPFYLVAKQFFDKKISLYITLLLAINPWAVFMARSGLRAILIPFLVCWCLYYLFRVIDNNKWRDWIFLSVFTGLLSHSYKAYPAMMVIILLVIFILLFKKKAWNKVLTSFGIILMISAPALYERFLTGNMLSRELNVLNDAKENQVSIIYVLFRYLDMFLLKGDTNRRDNFFAMPAIDFISSLIILFALGSLIYILIKHRNKFNWKMGIVALTFLGGMAVGIISMSEAPNYLRVSIALIPAILLVGWGINLIKADPRLSGRFMVLLMGLSIGITIGIHTVVIYNAFNNPYEQKNINTAYCIDDYKQGIKYKNTNQKVAVLYPRGYDILVQVNTPEVLALPFIIAAYPKQVETKAFYPNMSYSYFNKNFKSGEIVYYPQIAIAQEYFGKNGYIFDKNKFKNLGNNYWMVK